MPSDTVVSFQNSRNKKYMYIITSYLKNTNICRSDNKLLSSGIHVMSGNEPVGRVTDQLV